MASNTMRVQSSQQCEPVSDWLESRSDEMNAFFKGAPNMTDGAVDAAWLARIAVTDDLPSLQSAVNALRRSVHILVERGDADTLSPIITTMRAIVRRDPTAPHAM